MRSWPTKKDGHSLQGAQGFPSTRPAAATTSSPASLMGNKQYWRWAPPNYGCALHTPSASLFPGCVRLAVYLQQDPVALSQGSPGVSPRPSLDEQGRPSCRGQWLWASQRGKTQCSRRLMGVWHFLCARHSAGRSEERRVGKECRSRWSPYH